MPNLFNIIVNGFLLFSFVFSFVYIDLPEYVDNNIVPETMISSLDSEENSINAQTEVPLDKAKIMKPLMEVVDYISDRVAEKVSASESGEKQQNGFDSVNAVAETMSTSEATDTSEETPKTGGNKQKTRKFRLTKKSKTNNQ